jgi:hypothetical protein
MSAGPSVTITIPLSSVNLSLTALQIAAQACEQTAATIRDAANQSIAARSEPAIGPSTAAPQEQ